MSNDFDTEETEDLQFHEVRVGDYPATTVGVSESGVIFLRGDLHPLGAFAALMKAAQQHIPYASNGAISALFPADWLKAECLHDLDRLRAIDNLVAYARSGFSQGAKMRQH
jgi:hypothetical protein